MSAAKTSYAGRNAFITGGASGMGRGMAEAFAKAGMNVVIADLREDALRQAEAEMRTAGLNVRGVVLDVTDRARWPAAADEAEALFGPVHVLVNNAGVGLVGLIDTMSFADWDFGLAVNLGGVVNGVLAMLPRMKAHGQGGRIIATASTAGLTAVDGASAYCAAKFAVTGFMEVLASELAGTPLGVSIFFPGPVRTSLGETTREVRGEAPPVADPLAPAAFDPAVFMGIDEVGARVLAGIERGARGEALLRAIPDETPPVSRVDVVRQFGTLLYNPIYAAARPSG